MRTLFPGDIKLHDIGGGSVIAQHYRKLHSPAPWLSYADGAIGMRCLER